MDYQYIGKNFPASDAEAKAGGAMTFTEDMALPNMAYMKLVLSPAAHGIVRSLDIHAAETVPGVLAILTPDNTPQTYYNRGRVRADEEKSDQEQLFTRHVRFVGDRIAAVVAETQAIADRAAALIRAEIDPLPAVFTPEEALKEQHPPLHETDNVLRLPVIGYGSYDEAEGVEFHHHSSAHRITHVTMETHCALADYEPLKKRMTVYSATQSTFGARSLVATLLGLPMSRVRVIKAPMGGSFGCKQEFILEPLAACASMMVGRPVMLRFNRSETMLCTMLKHPLESDTYIKFSPDLKITGLKVNCQLDAGAYQTVSGSYVGSISKKLSWTYDVPNLEYNGFTVCTNTPCSGSYRGWGGPEAALIVENMMNAAARHFKVDPIELRLRNALPPYAISRLGNYCLGNLPVREALELGRERFRWEERKARIAAQDRSGRYLRGIGMAVATHTSGYYPRMGDWGTVTVKMEEDASVSVNCNVHDHGCGEVAIFKNMVAEVLSIPPETVDLPEGDSAYNALDNGCYTSRTIYVLGKAIVDACEKLLKRLEINAAEMLSCEPEELGHKDGMLFVVSEPERRVSYSDVSYYVANMGQEALFITHTNVPESNPGPVAEHFAEVEVDTYTGLCRVVGYLAIHDVGKALNPALCRGQVGSAVQQGIGYVFCEEIKIDRQSGRVTNADLQRYHVARACDMPNFDIYFIEQPDEYGPFGAKSVGEACFVPTAPALIAAVNDALGTELSMLPLDPTCILNAIKEKKEGEGKC